MPGSTRKVLGMRVSTSRTCERGGTPRIPATTHRQEAAHSSARRDVPVANSRERHNAPVTSGPDVPGTRHELVQPPKIPRALHRGDGAREHDDEGQGRDDDACDLALHARAHDSRQQRFVKEAVARVDARAAQVRQSHGRLDGPQDRQHRADERHEVGKLDPREHEAHAPPRLSERQEHRVAQREHARDEERGDRGARRDGLRRRQRVRAARVEPQLAEAQQHGEQLHQPPQPAAAGVQHTQRAQPQRRLNRRMEAVQPPRLLAERERHARDVPADGHREHAAQHARREPQLRADLGPADRVGRHERRAFFRVTPRGACSPVASADARVFGARHARGFG